MRSNSNPMSSKKKRSEDSGLTKPGLLYAVRFCSLVAVGLSGYLAWVSFAAVLNLAIVQLNGRFGGA